MSEFGEPWEIKLRVTRDPESKEAWIKNAIGHIVCIDAPPALRERLVACVNFLAGVPTEDLEAVASSRGVHKTITDTIKSCAGAMRGDGKNRWVCPRPVMRTAAEVEAEYALPPGYLTGVAENNQGPEANASVAENSQGGHDAGSPEDAENDTHLPLPDASRPAESGAG